MFFGQSTVSLYHYIPVVYKCTPQPHPPFGPISALYLPRNNNERLLYVKLPLYDNGLRFVFFKGQFTPPSPKQSQSVRQSMNEPIATNREAAFTPHLPSRLPFDWSLWAAPTIPPSYPPRAVCSPPPERYGLSFGTTSTSDHVHPCRHLILCMGLKLLVFTALRGLRGGPCRAVMAVNSLGGGVWRYLQHCCHWSGQSLACEYIYVCIACTLWRGPLS